MIDKKQVKLAAALLASHEKHYGHVPTENQTEV